MKQFTCPNCGGLTPIDRTNPQIVCTYCDSAFENPHVEKSPAASRPAKAVEQPIAPQSKKRSSKKGTTKGWWILPLIILSIMGNANKDADEAVTTVPSQSIVQTEPTNPKQTEKLTTEQKNALRSAETYLKYGAFSYEGLISQLEYEKYSADAAKYAADHCGADWTAQALKSAQTYLTYSNFSYTGLIKQLQYEKFTKEQAVHAADHCGADWFEQAAKCAENYLKYAAFSRERLIDQLLYEGFTQEQAEYGVEQNGY